MEKVAQFFVLDQGCPTHFISEARSELVQPQAGQSSKIIG